MHPHLGPSLRLLAALGVASLTAACGAWPRAAAVSHAAQAHTVLAAGSTAQAPSGAGRAGSTPVPAPPAGAPASPAARILPPPLPSLDIHSLASPAGSDLLAAWSGPGCYGGSGTCTGRLLRSTDGGRRWSTVYSTDGFLRGLSFPDATHGWALGGTCDPEAPARGCTSTVLATADGGLDWTSVYTRRDVLLSKVDFVDARHGWLSLQTGALLRTSDGGATWSPAASPCAGAPGEGELGSFAFTGTRAGFAVCESPAAGPTVAKAIVWTDDGGRSWTPVGSGLPASGAVVDMAFSTPATGWLCTWPVGGPLFVTRDGGRIWNRAAAGLGGANFVAIAAAPGRPRDISAVVGLGPDGAVVTSADGGQTWRGLYPAVGPLLGAGGGPAVQFVGPLTGYAVGMPSDPNAVFRTADGGSSWTGVGRLPSGAALIDWSFAGAGAGWAVVSVRGGPPELLATQNAGRSWSPVAGAPPTPQLALRQSGGDGLLVAGPRLLRTADAGRTWTALGSVQGVSALAAPAGGAVWAVVRGRLRRSGDGGRTWVPAGGLPAGDQVLGLSFADREHGWVLTAGGCAGPGVCAEALWITADGGRTWSALSLGALKAAGIDFATAADGWLTTVNGTLYRTTDGGRTWQGL